MPPTGETITILKPGTTTDPYSGQVTKSWGTAQRITAHAMGVAPVSSFEPTPDGRQKLIDRVDVYFSAAPPAGAGDRVIVRGQTLEVDGEPARWVDPWTGQLAGVVVRCKVVEG